MIFRNWENLIKKKKKMHYLCKTKAIRQYSITTDNIFDILNY